MSKEDRDAKEDRMKAQGKERKIMNLRILPEEKLRVSIELVM